MEGMWGGGRKGIKDQEQLDPYNQPKYNLNKAAQTTSWLLINTTQNNESIETVQL